MMKETNYVETLIRQMLAEPEWQWLSERGRVIASEKNSTGLQEAFSLIPRKTGSKGIITTNPEGHELYVQNWATDRLCRVWLIMQLDSKEKNSYLSKVESLFSGASMNELVALYSALPVLAFPEEWIKRCAEGIRSNIGTVLEAIMYENSYPFHYLDESAFNQMILKAFFTDKNVDRIIGFDQRANGNLARILFDYAHERQAAGRTVDPQLWRLTAGYLNQVHFTDIQNLWNSGSEMEKKAALLVCAQSDFPPAKELWANAGSLRKEILEKKLTWHNLNG